MKKALQVAVVLASAFLCSTTRGQSVLTPVATDGVRIIGGMGPFACGWGYGDVMGYLPSEGFEDQTVIDFDLSGIQQSTIISDATLTLSALAEHIGAQGMTVDISTFYGESTVQGADWTKGTYYMSFGVVNEPEYVYTLNLTSAVQAAVDQGQSFLDLRLSTPLFFEGDLTIDPSWGKLLNLPSGSLTVTIAPEFQAVTLTNSTLNLTWGTEAGAMYQLQYNADVNSSNWLNLGSALTATGASLSTTDVITNGPQRFYRLVLSP